MEQILANWQSFLWSIGIVTVATVFGLVVHKLVFTTAMRLARRTPTTIDQLVLEGAAGPARLALPLLFVSAAVPMLPWDDGIDANLRHAILIGLMAAGGWLGFGMVGVLSQVVAMRYRVDVADNLMARRVRTQFLVLQRILGTVIMIVTVAAILLTFPTAWKFGAGLFASAGAAGLVVGLAARPVLENLLAGIQIALTQPIRIDDQVVVQGEFGNIEELGATYVVIRIWDGRRLIVPLSHFISQPFENWTRSSSELMGTVYLYVDYSVSVEDVRAEVKRIVEASPLWDKRVWNLQVTNMTEKSVELRVLVSAASPGFAWDLRCQIREKIIEYLGRKNPQALPTTRTELYSRPEAA